MKEFESGCKGCATCSCNHVSKETTQPSGKDFYTAPDGEVYEIGKKFHAEPYKVYENDYGGS